MKDDCYDLSDKDIKDIVDRLVSGGSILFSFSPDQKTAYNIFLSSQYTKLNVLSFGGNARGQLILALQGMGGFMYVNPLGQPLHMNYISEKLHLHPGDAMQIAELILLIQNEYKDRFASLLNFTKDLDE